MRVVHQLIGYFKAHGALSSAQLEQLRSAGFLPDWLDDSDLLEETENFFDDDVEESSHKIPAGIGEHPEDEQYFRPEKPLGVE